MKLAWPTSPSKPEQQQQQQHEGDGMTYITPPTPATVEYEARYGAWAGRTVQVASPQRSVQQQQQQQRVGLSPSSTRVQSSSVEYTTKALGDKLNQVTELNPTTPSQMIRLKHRASTLIQRYAGSNWREAQRSKWLLDLVAHIDKDYREYILDQANHIKHLQEQVSLLQQSQGTQSQEAQFKIMDLGDTVARLQSQVRDSDQVILDLQTRLANAEGSLNSAEQAASVAAHECLELQQAVRLLAENESATRRSMAQRNFVLKDGLRRSEGKARQLAESERRHKLEVQVMCKLHDEDLVKEKGHVERRYASQILAVQAAEQAAAQIAVERVKMEMEAYKEPWTYLHGKKSPTPNAEIAQRLGLRMTSLNTLHVPP